MARGLGSPPRLGLADPGSGPICFDLSTWARSSEHSCWEFRLDIREIELGRLAELGRACNCGLGDPGGFLDRPDSAVRPSREKCGWSPRGICSYPAYQECASTGAGAHWRGRNPTTGPNRTDDAVDSVRGDDHALDVTFVVSHVTPTLGLERVFLDLLGALAVRARVKVVVIGGSEEDLRLLPVSSVVLGPPLRRRARVATLTRLFRHRRAFRGTRVVYVGAWAAVPGVLVAPRSCRVVVWEHSLIAENVATSRALRVLQIGARVAYRRASQVVVVSDPLKNDLHRLGLQAITIPNPLDLSPAVDLGGATPDCHQLCTVGSLTVVKNQSLLIRAMALLPQRYRLVVVGDGPLRDSLVSLAEELAVSDRVDFRGHLPRDEALKVMGRSRALLHASVGETFGLVFAEAALMGVPTVAVRNRLSEEWMLSARLSGQLVEPIPVAVARAVLGLLPLCEGSQHHRPDSSWLSSYSADCIAEQWSTELARLRDYSRGGPAKC